MSNVPDHVFNDLKDVNARVDLLEQEQETLRKILSDAGLSKDYLNALSWQMVRATFHANQSFNAAKADTQSAQDVEAGGAVWKEPAVIAIAETIACVHAMHAMGDTILEMITDLFFQKEIKKQKKAILEKMKSDERFQELYKKLSDLESSKEFQYIKAFCNTVKHEYYVIHHGQAVVINVGKGEGEQGIEFGAFEYKKVTHKSLWAREIYLDYRGEMFEHVADVLKEIPALVPQIENSPE